MKFLQVGGRVRLVKRNPVWDGGPRVGARGTIRVIDELAAYQPYGVEFDRPVENGHNAEATAKEGHGWFCDAENLELVREIVPYADFNTKMRICARDVSDPSRELFMTETIGRIQVLDETVSETRRVAVAAEAQAKAQALALAEFERRWMDRLSALLLNVVGIEERLVKLEKVEAEHESRYAEWKRWSERLHSLNKDIGDLDERTDEMETRITELREVSRKHVEPLERGDADHERRIRALESLMKGESDG